MATTPRLFVLNAPSIAGDLANMSFALFSSSLATLVAATNTGITATAEGYTAAVAYDLSWTGHGLIRWYHSAVEVGAETFDVPDAVGAIASIKLKTDGLITLATGTVGASPGAMSFTMTGSSLLTTPHAYRGRRIYFITGSGPTDLTDPCLDHTVSGSVHTFTFTLAQTVVPALNDVGVLLGT